MYINVYMHMYLHHMFTCFLWRPEESGGSL